MIAFPLSPLFTKDNIYISLGLSLQIESCHLLFLLLQGWIKKVNYT